MTGEQKRTFKIGAMNLMVEILEYTRSDQRSFTGQRGTSVVYLMIPLQEV